MKKIILLLLIIFLLTGCANEENKKTNTIIKEKNINTNQEEEENQDKIKLSIYQYKNKNEPRIRLNEYTNTCITGNDIGSFEIFLTDEEQISNSNFQTIWKQYKDNYENIDDFKIGYHIKFTTNDGKNFDKDILKPSDTSDFFNYIQTYLYDDVNQKEGSWYSHITDNEYNENTILTSIKLTSSDYIDKLTSPITLEAFIYNNKDNKKNNKYQIKIYCSNINN